MAMNPTTTLVHLLNTLCTTYNYKSSTIVFASDKYCNGIALGKTVSADRASQ